MDELTVLALGCLLAIVHILLPIAAKTVQYGPGWTVSARDEMRPAGNKTTGRLERAQANFFETFPVMIAAATIVSLASLQTYWTEVGAWVWLSARLVYLPLYTFGVAVLRSLAWTASLVGIVMVLYPVLRAASGV